MRFERKFIVSESLRGDLRSFLSINSFKKEYPSREITSIYYDSDKFEKFHESEEGIQNRIKIRLRFYNREIEKIKLEKKIKSSEIGTKEYINLDNFKKDFLYLDLTDHKYKKVIKIPKTIENIYTPVLIVKYLRDYYANQDKSIRITYDYKLVFSNIYNRKSQKIIPFYIPGTFSVIEIKYGNNILVQPEIIGLISDKFNVHISRFSKYTEAIKACF